MDIGGSILDRIIASKEDQEKQDFQPLELIAGLLRQLTDKEADVLQRRYGLNGVAKETLEAIGSSYHVTRERIRQIENLAVKKLKEDSRFHQQMKPVEHVVLTTLEEHGGIMHEDHLLTELATGAHTPQFDQALVFILTELLDDRVSKVGVDKMFMKGWRMKTADIEFIASTLELLAKTIATANTPLDLDTLMQQVQSDRLTEKTVLAMLEVSAVIDHNPFDEYGLREWGSVVPKRMNDKIYLVLKKMGKPMHFVDIAKNITEVFKKEAYPPTVHNELILNSHYVLVGRGIYALKEWGYQKGVVADVIADILKTTQQPMTRDAIVETVLEQRMVKKNTIHLALTNKQLFTKLPDGRYTLAPQPTV
ncbi:MAG: hypothetical protein HY565_03180 [Candidatus Kerfeldbacteria bacterium]|nr:hypothetical protein [Candidatus Kerfeldbacteria bacterium]